MTLTDREYQHMRDVGIAVLREVGVDTGGCNIQFAVHPETGRLVVIEMNPRVSRSSALASKATGFPIAKIAAKLAIGYTLDEIRNDITGETPAAFEPTLDYVVVKIPRFAFEKFPGADPELTTTMKSVGEAMALGRSFAEALGKALRSMETAAARLLDRCRTPTARPPDVAHARPTGGSTRVERALRAGRAGRPRSPRRPASTRGSSTRSTGWSALRAEIVDAPVLDEALLRRAKRAGLSDRQLAALRPELAGEDGVRTLRHRLGVRPVYKTVDTCAAEFAARTPYHYSAYETDPAAESEIAPQTRAAEGADPRLRAEPDRAGHRVRLLVRARRDGAARPPGYETVMVNCNPETVSTDYDTADRLYFEPLTFEDVLEVVHAEQALGHRRRRDRAARRADPAGARASGSPTPGCRSWALRRRRSTWPRTAARSARCSRKAGLPAPAYGTATSFDAGQARSPTGSATRCWSGPSYVLGGRGMEIVYDDETLAGYIARATDDQPGPPGAGRPVPRRRHRDRRRRAVRRRPRSSSAA